MTVPGERERVVAEIQRIEEARREAGRARAKELGMPLRVVRPDGTVQEVAGIDEFGQVVYFITHNTNAAISSGANALNASPYNIAGSGELIGMWDGGAGRATHQEFGGRLAVKDGSAVDNHATHVGGTMVASGVSANAKGMAPAANVDSYDWNSDKAEMTSRGAAGPNEPGKIFLSNHSYGYGSGWNHINGGSPYRKWEWYGNGTNSSGTEQNFGRYNSYARDTDSLAHAAPYYLIFRSAGNDRTDNPANGDAVSLSSGGSSVVTYNNSSHPPGDGNYRSGFENIGFDALAKNVATVGAVTDAVSFGSRSPGAANPTSFSSFGPTDDGRIKPDLVANGDGLYSSFSSSDNAYGTMSGTSMAAPSATGTAALVVQEYRRLFPGGAMRSSTLKGLLIHTADDRGNAGPDYKFGWGLINGQAAVDTIRDHQSKPAKKRITESTLNSSTQAVNHDIIWDGSSPIRVTLCWTDPAGTSTTASDLRSARLKNDLNVKVVAPDTSEHFPFVMPFVGNWTAAAMDLPATRGVNTTDNVEQVYIATPPVAGQYRIAVSYTGTLTNNQQPYSLLVSGSADQAPSGALPTAWHNPVLNEPLISQTMRNPVYEVPTGSAFTVFTGVRKFNNPDYGAANQTGGTLYFRAGTSGNWTTTPMAWHSDNGDYQFWKADLPGSATSGVVQYFIRMTFDSGVVSPAYLHGNDGGGFVTTNMTVAQSAPYSLRNRVSWAWHEPGIAGHQTVNGTTATLNAYTGYIAKDGSSYQGASNGTVYYTTDGSTPVGGLGLASDSATLAVPFSYIAKQSNASGAGDQMHWRAVLSGLPGGSNVKYRVGFWNSATNEEKFQPAASDASFDLNIESTDTSATVVLGNLSQTYDGTARSVSVATNPAGLSVSVTYNGSATAPTAAGNYSVGATVTQSGYSGSASGTLVVARKGLTVSGLAAANKIHDGTTSATVTGNASLAGVVAGDSGQAVLGGAPVFAFADANIGLSKPVTASGYTVSGNKSANYLLSQPTLAANITMPAGSTLTEISGSTQSQAESPVASSNGTSHAWTPASDIAGFNGAGFLQAAPDNGTKLSGTTGSPMLSYTVNVTHPGTYYLWLRGYAATADKARAFVGLNNGTASLVGLSDLNAWKWTNSNRAAGSAAPVAFTVAAAGNQTLKVWMADAGFRLDQLLLTVNPDFSPEASPDFWRNQNIYQILTDRFFDGNPANNNVYGWADPNIGNKTHGGDFEGIIGKLDYVKALGATALWISPVVKNGAGDYDYHGYAGTDFYNTDPRFGSLADLRRLVFEANRRGIMVVNDVVVNHASTWVDSAEAGWPAFRTPPSGYTLRYNWAGNQYAPPFDNASLTAAFGNSNLSNIFHNHGAIQDWNNATQVEFGEFATLDDFRTSSQYVRDRMAEIYSWWIQQAGFDAFRVDTVKHVEMGFWNDWNPRIRAAAAAAGKPNFFQFGEVYDGSDGKVGSYTGTKTPGNFKFDSAVDFPLYYQAKSVFASADAPTGQIETRYANLNGSNYDPAAFESMVTFLDNHDLERFMQVSGNNTARLDVALAFLYTARGIPTLYYGTEQDFNGGHDPANREDMFDGAYEAGPSLGDNFNMASPRFKRVALLNNLRRLYPALRTGTHHNLWADFSGPGLLAYARRLGGEEVFVVLNTASTSQTIGARPTIHPAGTVLVNLLNTAEAVTVAPGSDGIPSMAVPAMSAKIFVAQAQAKPLSPVVESATPSHAAGGVPAIGNLTVSFSKAMNRTATQSAVSIAPPVPGNFSWNSGNTVLTFTPSSVLSGNTAYTLSVGTNATAGDGTAFHAPFSTPFQTAAAPVAATVTLGNLTQTYNRTARAASATTNPAGLAVSVTYNGSAAAPANAGNYTVNATITEPGYTGSATGTLAITRKGLTISGLAGANKAFDGTTNATATGNATLVGVETNDTVALGGTPRFAFATATVGNNKAITASGYTISGGSAANYSLAQPAGLTANITTAPATATLGNLAQTYNRTARSASVSTNPAGLAVSVTYNGSPAAPTNAGNYTVNATITQSGYSGSATGTLSIAPKGLTITGLNGADKTYDGTTTAGVTGAATLVGVESGDTVTIGGTPSFAFADSAVGTNKPVTASGYTISGGSASNYSLAQPTGLTASITAASATITLGNLAQTYNSTPRGASASTSPAGLAVSVAYNGSPSAPANAGNYTVNATVTEPGYTGSATGTLSVAPKALGISGLSVVDKPYDGTTSAEAAGTPVLVGVEPGDTVVLGGTPAFAFADPEAGTNKPVSASGYTISGASAPNYLLAQPAGLTANITSETAVPAMANATVGGTFSLPLTHAIPASGGSLAFALADGALPPGVLLDGAAGILSGTPEAAGNFTANITASNPLGAATARFAFQIARAPQSISGLAPTERRGVGTLYLPGATATSNLAVGYLSSNTSVATVYANTVTARAPGTVVITARQTGNANWLPAANAIQTLTVVKGNQTVAFNELPNRVYGTAPFALAASSSSKLPVAFSSSNTSVATVSGNMVVVHAAGNTTITATQGGNGLYNAAEPVARALAVNRASQTIAFALSGNRSLAEGTVPLDATSSAGLPVEFTSSNTSVAAVSGNSVVLLASGTARITALQGGDANHLPATSVARALTVAALAPAVATGNASAVVATGAALNGEVASTGGTPVLERGFFRSTEGGFADGTGTKVSVSGSFGSGAFSLNATGLLANTAYYYKAFARNSAGTSYGAEQSFTTARTPQTISFGGLTSRAFGSAPFNLAATASSNLAVSFASSNPSVAAVSGNTVTILGAGNATITADQPGNGTFAPANPVSRVLVVARRGQKITFGALPSTMVTSPAFALAATSTSNLAVAFTSSNPAVATVAGNVVTPVSMGTTVITASQPGDSNHLPAPSVSQNLTVVRGVPLVETRSASPAAATAALSGAVLATNGANALERGFFTSTTNGFADGLGTKFSAPGNFTAGPFSLNATGLMANTTYYYKAFARNSGGTAYGAQQSFTTGKAVPAIAPFSLAGRVGVAQTHTVNSTNSPDSFAVSAGTLPAGLSLNTATGVLSGTPAAAGSGNFTLSATNSGGTGTRRVAFSVAKGDQTVSGVAGTTNRTAGTSFAAGGAASSGLPVAYSTSKSAVVSIGANGTLNALAPGVAVITATQPGNANWNAAPAVRQVVAVGTPLAGVVFTPPASLVYDGAAKPHTASVAGVTVWSYYYTGRGATVYYGTTAPAFAGSYTVTAVSGTGAKPGFASAHFTIAPKPVSLALSGLDKTYDGTTAASAVAVLQGRVGADDVAAGGTPVLAFDSPAAGTGKPVAVSGYALSGSRASNYALAAPSGTTANITARPLTVAANDVEKNIGEALAGGPGSTAFAAAGLLSGQSLAGATISYGPAAAAGSPGGLYTGQVVPSGAVFASGNASNYSIQYISGNLLVSEPPPGFLRPLNEGNGTVTVRWAAVAGALGYQVQSSLDAAMSGAVLGNSTETEATYVLGDNTVNFFRVRALHGGFAGRWSGRHVVQLVRINPGATHYAGLAAHPGNFTVDGIFGAANEAGLAAAATSANATRIQFLAPSGDWSPVIFRSSTANAWVQGTGTPAGAVSIPAGTGFTLRNPSATLKQYAVLSGPAFANTAPSSLAPSGAGKWTLFSPLRSRASLLSDLGFNPGAAAGNFLAGPSQSASDYIIVNDGKTGAKAYWFNILENRWYSGTAPQPSVPSVPAGVGLYIRQQSASTWGPWQIPVD